jgi:sugar/nucleoside kinase (ribokinase family)
MTELMKPKTVISLGDLVADLIVAIPRLPVEPDVHQLARQFRLEPGGAGNFLIAGTRLGMDMLALGTIGDDPFGGAALEILIDEGVDTSAVIQQSGTGSTTVVVLVDDDGQHVFLGGYGEGPAINLPEIWKEKLIKSQALFASGYTLQEKRLAEAALEIMSLAHRSGIPVFFDPGPEMLHTTSVQLASVLASSEVILLTEDEIPLMTGGEVGVEAAADLLGKGPQMVCIKRGSRGCVILTVADSVEHAGYQVTVRDTTAAGDSFAAAFIYAYLSHWNPDKIAAFSNAMGAAKVRKVGSGRQVPTADEVRSILQTYDVKVDY